MKTKRGFTLIIVKKLKRYETHVVFGELGEIIL